MILWSSSFRLESPPNSDWIRRPRRVVRGRASVAAVRVRPGISVSFAAASATHCTERLARRLHSVDRRYSTSRSGVPLPSRRASRASAMRRRNSG